MATNDHTNEPAWGPAHPHPLSQLQTELVWEGKYDEYGNRRTVDSAGLGMPMQRIETIDEPRARAEAQAIYSIPRKPTSTTSATGSSGATTSW
jgi:hypothetical protein